MGIAGKIFSIGSQRPVKHYRREAERVTALEPEYEAMTDEELLARNGELREKAMTGRDDRYVREHSMALLREHIRRHDGRRAYDVQIMAALALWDGNIIEASTGSGKTLMSHFPSYIAALHGKQTHVVTVNEYLTLRDAEEAAELLGPLGVAVGRVYSQQPNHEKHLAYKADVVYGTPSELGFDYLRDNMVRSMGEKVQTRHDYVIIDEVDSVLIDEARTPLIISGGKPHESGLYVSFAQAVRGLERDVDYILDEKTKLVAATEAGLAKIESRLGFAVFSDESGERANHLMQALKAEYAFFRDKDYVVTDGEVLIVDPNTGRTMAGRRWSEGLHQAIEAKEGVRVQPETVTLATITLQNYFRLYDKISGMTGTALTEATEFRETYGVETIGIPDNKPRIRVDETDVVYATEAAKYAAVVEEIARAHATGQPVLVGTVSVEHSEHVSHMLDKVGIPHTVLNAKHHAKEAEIVAQAGRLGAVTIATNMAGRGTDIILGGNVKGMARDMAREKAARRWASSTKAERERLGDAGRLPTPEEEAEALAEARAVFEEEQPRVMEAGGLYVIGTERHESRRIDNQLRGRSGRQGDPGRSVFFVSLEDELLRHFGGEGVKRMVRDAYGDSPLVSRTISKSIESAQGRVEKMHYEQRKNTLDFDDVINRQRAMIYNERDNILRGKSVNDRIDDIIYDEVTEAFDEYAGTPKPSGWDEDGLLAWYENLTGESGEGIVCGGDAATTREGAMEAARHAIAVCYGNKRLAADSHFPHKTPEELELMWVSYQSQIMLATIDKQWQGHLTSMNYLLTGIQLRGIGQRDPRVEYRRESRAAFDLLVDGMYSEFLGTILRMRIKPDRSVDARRTMRLSQPADPDGPERLPVAGQPVGTSSRAVTAGLAGRGVKATRTFRKDPGDPFSRAGRNEPCPCGSGKKFKNCHGRGR